MADKTVIVKIEYDTDEAQKNLDLLTKTLVEQNEQQARLKDAYKKGEVSTQDYTKQSLMLSNQINKTKGEAKDYVKVLQSEVNTIERAKAQNAVMIKQRNQLSKNYEQNAQKIQNLNDKIDKNNTFIKKNSSQLEKFKMNVGNYKSALEGLPGPIGNIVSGVGRVTSTLAKIGPIGALVGAAVAAIATPLVAFFTKSEKGFEMMERKMSGLKAEWNILVGELIKGGEKMAEGFEKPERKASFLSKTVQGFGVYLTALTGNTKHLQFFTDLSIKMNLAGEAAEKTTAKMQELEDLERGMIVPRALANKQMAEAKLRYQDETLSIQDRIDALEQSLKIEIATNQKEIEFAKMAVSNLQSVNELKKQAGQLRDEDLKKEEEAQARVIELETESMIKRRKVASTLNSAKEEMMRGSQMVQTEIDIAEDKSFEDTVKMIEQEQKLIDEKFKAENELVDEQLRIKGKAIVVEAKIKAKQYEPDKEMREQALQDAKDSLQDIIDVTQGYADARITIMSEMFAKLAQQDWSNVKTSKDAFIAIGSAAAGLTGLITAQHEAQLNDLKAQKEAELALVGDDTAAKEAIEAKYNKKLVELKKRQAKEEKKKALIDAAIATALAIVKGLASGLPMPGILMAALAAVMGGIQIAAIAKQPTPQFTSDQVFAEGGAVIGGRSHAQGGTKFVGSDGSRFVAEKGEGLFVMKKDATAEIAAYSAINESHGGRSWNGGRSRYLQNGGEVDTTSVEESVNRTLRNTPIFVRVGDIETGLTETSKVKQAGVI
jgi:hypothetical protein